jgi:ribosomal protein L11 methyltransferase
LTPDAWTSVRVRRPTNRAAVINALFQLGAEGIQELDEDIVTHFRNLDERETTTALRTADAAASVEFAATPNVDWSAAWRSRITSHRLGRLVVTPPWLAEEFSAAERIVIDPGMAFGTGEHESTRGVLRLMQNVVRRGDTVADIGAGSAVLAIAAAKLGARQVIAIELDADAIGNAEENAVSNGVADRVSIMQGDAFDLLPLVAPVRVVLANIISSVLVELLPVIAAALPADGIAIVSGILADEKEEMLSAFEQGGWATRQTDEEGLWWSAAIGRP